MRLNQVVPNFSALTSHGPLELYAWQGDSWVVLFSHPADWSPVSGSELGRLAVLHPEFQQRGVKLLALRHPGPDQPDTVLPANLPYPVIRDDTRELAVHLDIVAADQRNDPEALAVRSLYVIGPDRHLKLAAQYPAAIGRNIDEILRAIDSMQLFQYSRHVNRRWSAHVAARAPRHRL